MADFLQNLGQQYPPPATLTQLYQCQAPFTGAVVSNLVMCNQGTQPAKFRVSLAINGANDIAPGPQYLFYDVVIQPNETRTCVIGITMAPGDVLRCQSDMGTVSFNASGVQTQ